MTENEWLKCNDPIAMFDDLLIPFGDRRIRLFGCACVRQLWDYFHEDYEAQSSNDLRRSIMIAEAFADGRGNSQEVSVTYEAAVQNVADWFEHCFGWEQLHSLWSAIRDVLSPDLRATIKGCVHQTAEVLSFSAWMKAHPDSPELVEQVERQRVLSLEARFLRDIFGNPFRPETVDPHWLSPKVLSLARSIYEDRVFERLPLLADALMDAGCDTETLINHCRGPGPHVKSCWVVDLLLGKE